MNGSFETKDINLLCDYINVILSANEDTSVQIRILNDCEGAYIVDYVLPKYFGESFELFDEEKRTLSGDRIEFVEV